eukprot:9490189-Pyramimonas_sp.AAC.1
MGTQRIYTTTTSIPPLSSVQREGGVEGGGGGVYFLAPQWGTGGGWGSPRSRPQDSDPMRSLRALPAR